MSGICAVWRTDNPQRTSATLTAVTRGLALERADRVHCESDGAAGVGTSTRFSTQQIHRSPNLLLACDADLRNESELARMAGHNGNGGTGALLASLYEQLGPRFVEKLRGSFSIVLWDSRAQALIAAIDHFAIKRLAYYQADGVLLIASRIDALMHSGDIERSVNPRSIANVINFSINPGPETAFRGVLRIPPGSMLVATPAGLRIDRFWDMRYGVGNDSDEERLARELEAVVEESVAAQCGSDPPEALGAFLSGGTDSSTVVGMMSRLRRGRPRVKAFSIGFSEQEFNELEYADLAAKRFDAEHHKYFVTAADCAAALPRMVRYFDEPFGNSSAIPTYFCGRLAAEHGVRVLLAGDGGDELFGGNEVYRIERIFQLYHRVPGLIRGVLEPVLRALPFERGVIGKARRYVRRANLPELERMLSHLFLHTHRPSDVFEPEFLKSLDGYHASAAIAQHLNDAPTVDSLDRRLYSDVKTVLGDSDLPKVTCMSELAGVQARFPFIDRYVAEFSGRIPPALKVKGLQKRYLFKRAFRNLLPSEIIRKKKHGFGIPVAIWMKSNPTMHDLLHDTLRSSTAEQRGYFRPEFITGLLHKHESDETTFYGDVLWCFLVLELWHQQFVDLKAPAHV